MTQFNFDLNNAGEQRTLEVMPDGTICTTQLTIRPGGAGENGWLKKSANGAAEGLDCELTVTEGPYAKRKVFQWMVLSGTTPGHEEAAEITRRFLRALLESAYGIRPDDQSDAAKAARSVTGWGDFDQLRFIVRVGVRPPENGYPAKNIIREVITPDKSVWKQPEQLPRDQLGKAASPANGSAASAPAAAPTPTSTPAARPANAIARPAWAE
jgi:hypothetical protein